MLSNRFYYDLDKLKLVARAFYVESVLSVNILFSNLVFLNTDNAVGFEGVSNRNKLIIEIYFKLMF
jgi:hypothetical protein